MDIGPNHLPIKTRTRTKGEAGKEAADHREIYPLSQSSSTPPLPVRSSIGKESVVVIEMLLQAQAQATRPGFLAAWLALITSV